MVHTGVGIGNCSIGVVARLIITKQQQKGRHHHSSREGTPPPAELLLGEGVEIELPAAKNGLNPLVFSSRKAHEACAELLLGKVDEPPTTTS